MYNNSTQTDQIVGKLSWPSMGYVEFWRREDVIKGESHITLEDLQWVVFVTAKDSLEKVIGFGWGGNLWITVRKLQYQNGDFIWEARIIELPPGR